MKTKKDHYLQTAKKLSNLGTRIDITYAGDNRNEDEYKELKSKIKEAEMDNLFAAMAAYCDKENDV